MQKMILPQFIPHRGCLQQCVFCNQKTITGTSGFSLEQMKIQVNEQLNLSNGIPELAYFGGTFTGLPLQEMIDLLDFGLALFQAGQISGIRLSTHPVTVTQERVNILKAYPISLVELGIQSFSEDVLKASKRGCTREQIDEAISNLKTNGISFGIQLMMGLPEDTKARFLKSVQTCISYRPEAIRIYPTIVLEHTPLAEMYRQNLYVPISLAESVEWGYEALCLIKKTDIPVIRMGLHVTDELLRGSEVLAGPLHPAYRQLVDSEAVYRAIENALRTKPEMHINTIRVHPHMVSAVSGQCGANRKSLEALLGYAFSIQGDRQLVVQQLKIEDQHTQRVINIWT